VRSLRLVSFPVLLLSLLPADISIPHANGPAAPPPKPTIDIRNCFLRGCHSGVSLLAHLDVSPAELIAKGAFTACLAETCWDGKVVRNALDRSENIFLCEPQKPGPFPPFCGVGAEGTGAKLQMTLGAFEQRTFRDGDRVVLRVTVANKKVFDQVRNVKYSDYYPNGKDCDVTGCRVAGVEMWQSSRSGKTAR
jgi:hypothetical protein